MRQFINGKNRGFLTLWWAQVISQFGDRINQMALIGLIAGRTPGSAFELAKLLSFTIIPVFIVGPLAGVYVDRWDRRTTLFVCDFLRGMLVLVIPYILMQRHSMIPIYIVVFLAFCLSRFYVPAKMSIIPDLVEPKDILVANSLVSVTGMIAFVLGCAIGGFIVEKIGSAGGFIWDAATFFISGFLVWTIRPAMKININKRKLLSRSKEIVSAFRKSVFEEMKEGISYLLNQRDIRFIINMLFVLFAAAGAIYVVIIVFIQEAFESITQHLGFLAVFLGIGLFLGALAYGRLGQRPDKPQDKACLKFFQFKTIFFCLVLGGMMMAFFTLTVEHTRNMAAAAFLAFIFGLIVGPIIIAANTIVHQVSDENMRGKVFSSLEIVIHFAFLVSMLASSFLAERVERYWILLTVSIILILVGAVGWVRMRRGLFSIERI